jgi:hypothetical protein
MYEKTYKYEGMIRCLMLDTGCWFLDIGSNQYQVSNIQDLVSLEGGDSMLDGKLYKARDIFDTQFRHQPTPVSLNGFWGKK